MLLVITGRFLCVACVPASVNLLRYVSIFQFYGVLVIMLFQVAVDTINYLAIFGICGFGFGVAMMGLFPEAEQFDRSSMTFFTMFDFGMGSYDTTIFNDSPYKNLGKLLTMIYVVFTLIVIFNLLIARMSDSFAKINEISFFQWAKVVAKNGRSFMLLQERSPLSMLPPPLNIVPALVYPLHYWAIRNARGKIAKKLRPPKMRSNHKAAAEFKKKELLKFAGQPSHKKAVMVAGAVAVAEEVVPEELLYAPSTIADTDYFTVSIAGTLSDWVIK